MKKNHLYLTPVRNPLSLYENPDDKLLHTYVHIVTIPLIKRFAEIEVLEGTPLADGVALWRKYIHSGDEKLRVMPLAKLLKGTSAHLLKKYCRTLKE